MKVLCILSLMIVLISIVTAINWQAGDWAMSCDFKGNDLSNKNSRGEDCSGICSKTAGCTHYTWTNYNGGTCWMKSGNVGKNNAFSTMDKSMVCGIAATTQSGTIGSVSSTSFPSCQFRFGMAFDGNSRDYSLADYITMWIGSPSST
jgi:hypothetical protein